MKHNSYPIYKVYTICSNNYKKSHCLFLCLCLISKTTEPILMVGTLTSGKEFG